MRLVNWLEVLDPANPSGVLEKLLQKFDTGPSESSESSTFQHFQRAQQHVIFLMSQIRSSTPTTQLRFGRRNLQLQLRPPNYNFANATSTSPIQLQLHQSNFNLSKTTSTSLMQLQLCTVNLNFKFESDLHPQVQHLIFMCDGLSPFWLISLQRYA